MTQRSLMSPNSKVKIIKKIFSKNYDQDHSVNIRKLIKNYRKKKSESVCANETDSMHNYSHSSSLAMDYKPRTAGICLRRPKQKKERESLVMKYFK